MPGIGYCVVNGIPLRRVCVSHQSVQQFNDTRGARCSDPPRARVPVHEYKLQVGKASPTEGTLPSSVYIILKKLGASQWWDCLTT